MFEHMLCPAGIRAAREQEQFSRDQERLAEAQVRAKRLPGLCVWRVEGQPPESWSLTRPRPAQPSPVRTSCSACRHQSPCWVTYPALDAAVLATVRWPADGFLRPSAHKCAPVGWVQR